MIETVSYPANLPEWNPAQQPFYLELFGETHPLLDTSFAEVLPAGSTGGTPTTVQPAPIYEYWWTIGHPGTPHREHHFIDQLFGHDQDDLWDNLQDPAARIYLFFPLKAGWRIQEFVTTLKYLSPVYEQRSLLDKAVEHWKVFSPVVADASQLAALGGQFGVPWASTAAGVLDTMAKLQLTSVPPEDDLNWSVGKVTFGNQDGVMQGIMWTLPKKVFALLGGRITGSIALSFLPTQVQTPGVAANGEPTPQPGGVLAHAVVYGPNGQIWVPGQREFIRLEIAPVVPAKPAAPA